LKSTFPQRDLALVLDCPRAAHERAVVERYRETG
jgi:hypothetical protein